MLFGGILWRVSAQCPSWLFLFWVWEYLRVQGSLWADLCYFQRTVKTVAVLRSNHHWLYARSMQFQGWPFSTSMGWITLYSVYLQHKMTARKAGACCDRLCAYCHETCTRRQLSENKQKDTSMILAKPCRSVVLSLHIAENPRQHNHPQGEVPNYVVCWDPTEEWVLFNHCKFESLYGFLKLAVPNSQDIAKLLPDLSFIQSWKPFSGCLCCWRQCSPELNIARHCRGAYVGRWSVGYYAIK